ncbi:hypothetical protein QQ020_00810 [Fulvivirgaceae bacterium BMA12]|uniref:Uncharacterized protein n=1 Tax=Agaribacillus aureus TaxID=3051825 RepID=A0ABT8KYN9_9BACT|nr:hypothetical protein [Fulvivirgaceae bacterium BMA12]
MAVYTLNEAIQIIFNDREYYLSLSKIDRGAMRSYKTRYDNNTLTIDSQISIVKKYNKKAKVTITIEL